MEILGHDRERGNTKRRCGNRENVVHFLAEKGKCCGKEEKNNTSVLPAIACYDLCKAEEGNAMARKEGRASPRI